MSKGMYRIFRTKEEYKFVLDHNYNVGVDVGIQLGLEMAYAALGRKSRNFREGWFCDYLPILAEVIDQYGDLLDGDVKDDPDMWYFAEKLDNELKKYLGINWHPWLERYNCARSGKLVKVREGKKNNVCG